MNPNLGFRQLPEKLQLCFQVTKHWTTSSNGPFPLPSGTDRKTKHATNLISESVKQCTIFMPFLVSHLKRSKKENVSPRRSFLFPNLLFSNRPGLGSTHNTFPAKVEVAKIN